MTSSTAEQLCRQFSLAEILLATGDFSDAHVIGKGGFGKVYKGLIDHDGSAIVAIKRLASNSNQGEREFVTEMETLTKVRHRNLVSLIGYCNERREMILVYEYVANGTLADHLYKLSRNNDDFSSLMWNDRLKISIGAGRGLDYLHSGCSIIHRDVKSTNILLDENFTAKVSDFGLAKHLSADGSESHVSASLKGTFGYIDPSYFITGRLTKASDTYAFGVVLLELLTGKSAVDRSLAEDGLSLTMWAQDKIRNGKVDQIVAPNLKGEISEDCLKTFVGVAKRCLDQEPKKRLTMTRAVAQLELALEQQERKGPTRKLPFRPFNAFWNRGPKQDNNEVEVNMVPKAIAAIDEEDALEYKQTVDELQKEQNFNILPIEEDALEYKQTVYIGDELEKKQNVNMLPIAISGAEMLDMTDNFSSKSLIADGFTGGSVFHGVLKSGQVVAFRRLDENLSDQEFLAQVSTAFSLKHENVVKLLGYCADDGLQVFVCELAPYGSLQDFLLGRQSSKRLALEPCLALSWAQRIEIAVGAAKGLYYFHEKQLIHRNIKSSSI